MSGQRARSAVAADHRSVIAHIPGVPWWGAVLIAVTATAVGFAFDAGSGAKELTGAFSALYVIGCFAAVLAVRQSGVFTAVIQPPLILFVSVPGAYFLFHGATVTGVKDLLINCGYPLIERFPLMFFTSAVVLLVGIGRWYHGMSMRRAEAEEDATDDAKPSRARQHSIERPAKAAKSTARTTRTRADRPVTRTGPSRSRHTRPPETEIIEPVAERPRRPRTARLAEAPVPPDEPRRRPRTSSTREPRKQPPPSDRRAPYQRPERRSRFEGYEPFEPHGSDGLNGTHHPVSRVRYRGADDGELRAEYRTRPRAARTHADAWEYDA